MRILLMILSLFSMSLNADQYGQETYQKYCTVCHQSGLAGAPKFRSKSDWGPRCQQKKIKGLVQSAIKGINAMPAKGTCEACKADEILEAIQYMVPEDEPQCHS